MSSLLLNSSYISSIKIQLYTEYLTHLKWVLHILFSVALIGGELQHGNYIQVLEHATLLLPIYWQRRGASHDTKLMFEPNLSVLEDEILDLSVWTHIQTEDEHHLFLSLAEWNTCFNNVDQYHITTYNLNIPTDNKNEENQSIPNRWT